MLFVTNGLLDQSGLVFVGAVYTSIIIIFIDCYINTICIVVLASLRSDSLSAAPTFTLARDEEWPLFAYFPLSSLLMLG